MEPWPRARRWALRPETTQAAKTRAIHPEPKPMEERGAEGEEVSVVMAL
jgi:hypothetical protein